VQEILTSLLSNSHGSAAYVTVFGVLVACGLGLPLPEDVSLVLGGFLAHRGSAELSVMMAVGFLGILAGDTLIYLAGRRLGTQVGKRGGFFARIVTPEKRAKVEALFHTHGQKIVMIARFLPGVRAVTYFTAGSARMAYWRFIFWDGLAALASAPLFVFLGYRFGDKLDLLIDKVKHGEMAVVGALMAGLAAYLVYQWRSRVAQRREQQLQAAAGAPLPRPDGPLGGKPDGTPRSSFDAAAGTYTAGRQFEIGK
jgi:membrane protein DedA with SNARE-associated domain